MGVRVLLLLVVALVVPVFTSGATSSTKNRTFSLAPIEAAVANSSTFALVASSACNSSVVETIYGVYTRNRNLFDACVADSAYQIFPYSGKAPTRDQIGDMVDSPACTAILTAVVLSGVPECNLSSLPLLSAAETTVKVVVDVQTYSTQRALTVPSSERFNQMMNWRRDSNLARAAGLPCDSASQLFAEYETNLKQTTTNGTVRLLADLTVEYRLANGTMVRGSTVAVGNGTTAATNSSASATDTTPNQVQGYVTAANDSQAINEKTVTTASGAVRSWDWRMAFTIVVLAMVRLTLPLL